MQLTSLLLPWLCVAVISFIFALLYRWLFRRRLDIGLAWLAFGASTGLVALFVGIAVLTAIGHSFAPAFLRDLQAATTFGMMFKLALIYAALPEEAVKIGITILLLVLLPRRVAHGSDPAEMLLYAAIGFSLCESLLYVAGFSAMPQYREHLMAFAAGRGVFGSLLHALLAMVAGFLLARGWRTTRRWLWAAIAYALAVLLHASFDGSLLHMVFQGLGFTAPDTAVAAEPGPALAILATSAITLFVLAVIGLWRSRRLAD